MKLKRGFAITVSLFLISILLLFTFACTANKSEVVERLESVEPDVPNLEIVLKGKQGDSKFPGKSGGDARELHAKFSKDNVSLYLQLYEPNNYELKYYISIEYKKENSDTLIYWLVFTPSKEGDKATVAADLLLNRLPWDYAKRSTEAFPPPQPVEEYNNILNEHKDYIYAGYKGYDLSAIIPAEILNLPEGYDITKPYWVYLQIEDFKAQSPVLDNEQLS